MVTVSLRDGVVALLSDNLDPLRIAFDDSVPCIQPEEFQGEMSLKAVEIPGNVVHISERSFSGSGIRYAELHEGVGVIGEQAFAACASLAEVVIPASVTIIGKSAFAECRALWKVRYTGTKEQWNSIAIGPDNDDLLSALIDCADGRI
jgi:hypothetical protein